MNNHWIFDRIRAHGDKPFLAINGVLHSYNDLQTALDKIDALLSAQIPPGVSVGLLGDYSIQAIAALLWSARPSRVREHFTPANRHNSHGSGRVRRFHHQAAADKNHNVILVTIKGRLL